MDRERAKTVAGYWVALALTAATVALWGFAHRLYSTLLPGLAAGLSLAPAQADMARSAIAIGYFLMTLPGALFSRTFGYKAALLFGLGTFAIGIFLLYPAIERHSVLFFIAAATVFGSGLAILDVTTMPLVIFLGSREGAIHRTVLGASLSPLGALGALFVGHKILAGATLNSGFAHNLMALLSTIGGVALALAFVMEMVKFPPVAVARVAHDSDTLQSFLEPLRVRRYRYALVGISLCLFAQIIIAAFAPAYSVAAMPSLTLAKAQLVLVAAYAALLLGRLVGPFVMLFIAPTRVLVGFSALATLCAVISAVIKGPAAIGFLIATAFFMAILIPAMLAIALRDLGNLAKSAAGLSQFVAFTTTGIFALLAVANTALILPVVMFVPSACFAVITVLVLRLYRIEKARS